MASLPPFILNGWRHRQGEEGRAKADEELNQFTTSSLAETFMTSQLDKHFATPNRSVSAPSLASIAVGTTLETLKNSGDLAADVQTIAESLDSTILRQLLNDPRTPYHLLKTFLTLPQTLEAKDRRIVDVDEAVLQNEHYMRSRDSNGDGRYLVSLEDLSQVLVKDSQNASHLSFTRKDPPKGGLEVLDELRKRELTIQPSSTSFCKVFERITHGILRGLDWSNVLVAGGMVLTTLLHTDPSKDDDKAVRDPDIDLYIYGLGPEDANRKVEEVHDTWVRNLPANAQPRLVVKNAKTINLLSSYPHRRIEIVLKLLPSPTDVLFNFDLDACAIGFDGSRVTMLPRCARAIETGYSVFTMDPVWEHHLGDRRASQETCLFKYADRGFGLRILPSYSRSLEEDNLEDGVFMDFQTSIAYDPDTYDNVPTYVWDENFSVDELESTILHYNDRLWTLVRATICGKLGIPTRMTGYRDYSTRRIRRQVCGPSLAAVQEKQITIPVIVPWALEDYLLSTLPQQYGDIPSHFTDFKPLVPVHDPSKYDPFTAILPSLQDTASESGNLRYWVITNESMWAQQHRVLDETAELMWSLFHWFNQVGGRDATRTRTDSPACKWHLARSFRRRILLPEVSEHSAVAMKSGLPSFQETLLFRPWAFASPVTPEGNISVNEVGDHELFDEKCVLYPFPDDLFWHASDEGTWTEGEYPLGLTHHWGIRRWIDEGLKD